MQLIENINETKTGGFEKNTHTHTNDKPSARPTKIKGERIQVTNITNKRGDINADPVDIKGIIKEYYKQFNPMFTNLIT